MLKQIISLFQERKILSLQDVSIHFHIDDSATEGMLTLLVKKHLIKSVSNICDGCKNSCQKCDLFGKSKYYRWVGKSNP